jgi:hypothetical protein
MAAQGRAAVNDRLVAAVRIVAAASALATLALMLWAMTFSWSGLGFVLALMAWCVSPYALLAFVAGAMRASRRGAVALLVTTLLVAGAAAVAYIDAFFIHLDAQGALILVFMPVWQWVGAVVGIVVASLVPSR